MNAKQLENLMVKARNLRPDSIEPLPLSGSSRHYYRLTTGLQQVIGVCHADVNENRAFISFTRTFHALGFPVPEIYAVSVDERCYLLQDLGDVTLFSKLQELRDTFPAAKRDTAPGSAEETSSSAGLQTAPGWKKTFPAGLIDDYKRVISWLPEFQRSQPDFKVCYPRQAFDFQSMMWDLSYFKYYYLKLAGIPFNEQLLEDDFRSFTTFLLESPGGFFMYRDFQSRNVMIHLDNPWFIDYQGGRRGALQYDVASLLFDAKANLPQQVREELLEHYLSVASATLQTDPAQFLKYYDGYVIIRILQALGAYGFRGLYERKEHFLQSIPFAVKNLETLLPKVWNHLGPELRTVMESLIRLPFPVVQGGHPHSISGRPVVETPEYKVRETLVAGKPLTGNVTATRAIESPASGAAGSGSSSLTVTIVSFSFKKGLPEDKSGHGGGFIFDCRALPNPGRYDRFRELTGRDPAVIGFLEQEAEVGKFLAGVFQLVDQSVETYLKRDFTHLMVAFGCTGGQHRSVYCAGTMADHLRNRYQVNIELLHREL